MKRHWKSLVSVAALAFGIAMGAVAQAPEGYVKMKDTRDHRYQFEFRDFRDMLVCVRGKYFARIASELIR